MRKVRHWTPEEVEQLELWAGVLPIERIAKKLKRSKMSIRQKACYSGLNLEPEYNNISAAKLASILQIDANTVRYWIHHGMLEAKKCGKGKSSSWRIKMSEFKKFYLIHGTKKRALKNADPDGLAYLLDHRVNAIR
jgi:DNA-binding CsgD family transcriptional regulator